MANPEFQSKVKAKLAKTNHASHKALAILIKTVKTPQMQALAQLHSAAARKIESDAAAQVQKELYHSEQTQ